MRHYCNRRIKVTTRRQDNYLLGTIMEFIMNLPAAEICAMLFLLATSMMVMSLVGNIIAHSRADDCAIQRGYQFRYAGLVRFLRRRAHTGTKIFAVLLPLVFFENFVQALVASAIAVLFFVAQAQMGKARFPAHMSFFVVLMFAFIALDCWFYDVEFYRSMTSAPRAGFGVLAVVLGAIALAASAYNSFVQSKLDFYSLGD